MTNDWTREEVYTAFDGTHEPSIERGEQVGWARWDPIYISQRLSHGRTYASFGDVVFEGEL